MKKQCAALIISLICISVTAISADYSGLVPRLLKQGMPRLGAYRILSELTTKVGQRPAGSAGAAAAVEWGKRTMEQLGLQNVRLEPVEVPHWVRGEVEEAQANSGGQIIPLKVVALGGSIATPAEGVTAQVVEVRSLEEAKKLGNAVKGKIVFFNGPMDPAQVNTFEAYGKAGDQRNMGPGVVARAGAVAAIVRSLTLVEDDVPHTGATKFEKDSPVAPAAALSTLAANRLDDLLRKDPGLTVTLKLSAQNLPREQSANVIGEIVGSGKPDEVMLIGCHLDSWDKGVGAHDDGAGCAHVLEAASLIHSLNLKPKRTIRVVLFMNEEFGLDGAKAYATAKRPGEKCVAALESDAGGFTPRGFSIEAKGRPLQRILELRKWLQPLNAGAFTPGHSGSDVGEIAKLGVPGIGFVPDPQRYFDLHHSDHDTLDAVHPRELELGAISIATLTYLIAEEGL